MAKISKHQFLHLVVLISILYLRLLVTSSVNEEKIFNAFLQQYRKNYSIGSDEYYHRYNVYKENVFIQEKLNSSRSHKQSAWYGPTQFSDLTEKEFAEKYLSSYQEYHPKNVEVSDFFTLTNIHVPLPYLHFTELPSKVDWRDKNVVTPVKQQGHCGGCWAFSAVEAVESNYAIKTGNLVSLSVQEVIDCSYTFGKILSACNGGDTCTALRWMKEEKVHLVHEKEYPTKDKQQECKIEPKSVAGVQVNNYTCYNYVNKEDLLLKTIAASGPVSVSVDALSWRNYQGGIIQYHCGGPKIGNNHAVDIVGYDITGEIPYYIVKNSWGTEFGDGGYIYIRIGSDICGIVKEVSTVDVMV